MAENAKIENRNMELAPGPDEKANDRKDKVLQARVSKDMYNDLVRQAKRLRVPVSNLVRNILEDSLRMVENIVDGSLDIAEAIGKKASSRDLSSALGWQPMIANKPLSCAKCAGPIHKSDEAFISVGVPDGRTFVICGKCKWEM